MKDVSLACLFLLLVGCGAGEEPDLAATVVTPSPLAAVHIAIHGTFADGNELTGTLVYDADASPDAVNVRSLHPNAVYPVLSMDVNVGALSGVTPELCVGQCILSPVHYVRLYAEDARHILQLTFLPPVLPLVGPPHTLLDWGTLDTTASWIKSYSDTGAFESMIMLLSVQLTSDPTTKEDL